MAPDPSPAFVRARKALAASGQQATAAEAATAATALRAILARPAPAQRLGDDLDEFERFIDGIVVDCGLKLSFFVLTKAL